jgi:hypothetical protein
MHSANADLEALWRVGHNTSTWILNDASSADLQLQIRCLTFRAGICLRYRLTVPGDWLCGGCFLQYTARVIVYGGKFDPERLHYRRHVHCVAVQVTQHQRQEAPL